MVDEPSADKHFITKTGEITEGGQAARQEVRRREPLINTLTEWCVLRAQDNKRQRTEKYYMLEQNGKEADVYIFRHITSALAGVRRYELHMSKELQALNADTINVHINSYAGRGRSCDLQHAKGKQGNC